MTRYGEKLNAPPHFFASLATVVQQTLGDHFTELTDTTITEVQEILNQEEALFRKTLVRGQKVFDKAAASCAAGGELSGTTAWRLYDTYGFPIDLTKVMAQELGLAVNMVEYNEAKASAQLLSQSNGGDGSSTENLVLDVHAITSLIDRRIATTNDASKYAYVRAADGTYTYGTATAEVTAIWTPEGLADSAEPGQQVGILLDQTNFYAESGGQKSDTGFMALDGGDEFSVAYARNYSQFVMHVGTLQTGSVGVGDKVSLTVDAARRRSLSANHTATHLLNFALRRVLGEADQKVLTHAYLPARRLFC